MEVSIFNLQWLTRLGRTRGSLKDLTCQMYFHEFILNFRPCFLVWCSQLSNIGHRVSFVSWQTDRHRWVWSVCPIIGRQRSVKAEWLFLFSCFTQHPEWEKSSEWLLNRLADRQTDIGKVTGECSNFMSYSRTAALSNVLPDGSTTERERERECGRGRKPRGPAGRSCCPPRAARGRREEEWGEWEGRGRTVPRLESTAMPSRGQQQTNKKQRCVDPQPVEGLDQRRSTTRIFIFIDHEEITNFRPLSQLWSIQSSN